ncbi:RecQ family ATP-dependent DNA helicase [Liquorilactobacillus oeni]|uniref:ATP-dependent DNA helicase RecQ n=1 Tax=Liquorilactobacillus oeni DSM 19972 TaxID=1423777 RepID=A0A0R1MEN5_9LACO|nr:ATP-dependent DNA helicase RecQ [Liquorilactobacillus oeni]KRL04340.1 ATP-dependent DNA helicase [Liquorilactobacillus oeni DSM 19972]
MISDNFLEKKLHTFFGYTSFKEGQKQIIDSLLKRQSTLGILPTGTGKSLCYQLAGKLLNQTVLIVSPLLSLMQDQVEQLHFIGEKKAIAVTSELSYQHKYFVIHHLREYDYVYMAPEMLQKEEVLEQLKTISLGLFVVDEAHCISQWGPDFRPDYLDLKIIRQKLGNPVTLALTATATPEVEQDICRQLFNENESIKIVRRSVDRPNIFLAAKQVDTQQQKDEYLLEILPQLATPILLYFSSKKKADEISQLLNDRTDLKTAAYHAGLSKKDRYSIQQQFMNDQLDAVCATSAFGMGINKKNIRCVLHYHLPADLESYSQEIGRAGRDGQRSLALLLFNPADIDLQRHLSSNSLPDDGEIEYYFNHKDLINSCLQGSDKKNLLEYYAGRFLTPLKLKQIFKKRRFEREKKLQELIAYVETAKCRRNFLCKYFGEEKKADHNVDCCQPAGQPLVLDNFLLHKPGNNYTKSLEDYRKVISHLFNENKR